MCSFQDELSGGENVNITTIGLAVQGQWMVTWWSLDSISASTLKYLLLLVKGKLSPTSISRVFTKGSLGDICRVRPGEAVSFILDFWKIKLNHMTSMQRV